ncbi:DUF1538 domain-containing protein [Ferrimonas sediminicola]|uniref:DUF1538 domain-containing protein n=1 Tax=Ferrimonas sediminicola TaxID=2569538 RepID=A0A4U1B979_9GAMM|nr:DUF1538 domain-containing protein [Ferrimonas sediminicola]TKB47278.1 DUF1538 domain-containing protein [Ferrimonas sediminicola]
MYRALLALLGSCRDLLPIVLVVSLFQLAVLQQPLPSVIDIVLGMGLVVIGLTLFIFGLEMGLFPIGETLAQSFARKGALAPLLLFAFLLGFGTTVAEPALIAVADEAAEVAAAGGHLARTEEAQQSYATQLRLTVALSVGCAILLGVIRILKGWPLHKLIIGGYVIVMALTMIAPEEIIGIAYDSGGVTTSTITVPLVTALGVGLASAIKGRNPMVDGFGLIAFASLLPVQFVLIFGVVRTWIG